ncbi:MAG: tetratricopeptide repeat protein [Acidobacteriota bacterium]
MKMRRRKRVSKSRNNDSSHSPSSAYSLWLYLLTLIGVNALAYSNSFEASWHFDDLPNIIGNPSVQMTSWSWNGLVEALSSRTGGVRPVAYLTFAINYYFSGQEVFSYHVVNFLLHALNACLVLVLVERLLELAYRDLKRRDRALLSFLTALLWSVSPLHTQSVTYIVQRMNLLSAFFYLLSVVLFVEWRRRQPSMPRHLLLGAGLLTGLLAVLSKENALVLPVTILLVDYYFFNKCTVPRFSSRTWLIAILAMTAVVWVLAVGYDVPERIAVGYRARDFTLEERLLTQPRVIVFYLSLVLWPLPSRLALYHDFPHSVSLWFPWTTLLSLVSLLSLLIVAWYFRRRFPVSSFFVVWILLNLSIESSFFPLEMVFEHRTYLPSIGLFGGGLALVASWIRTGGPYLRRRAILSATLIPLALASGYMTWQRNETWRDEVTLWSDNAAKYPNSFRVWTNLGSSLANEGDSLGAENAFKRSISLNPEYSGSKVNLALLFLNQGKTDEALHVIEEVSADKLPPSLYYNLGVIYGRTGQLNKAIENYRKAIWYSHQGQYPEAAFNLALIYLKIGNYLDARLCFEYFLRIWKGEPESEYAREARLQIQQLEAVTR